MNTITIFSIYISLSKYYTINYYRLRTVHIHIKRIQINVRFYFVGFFLIRTDFIYSNLSVCVCSKLSDQLQSHCNAKPMSSAFDYSLSNLHSFHLKNIPNKCIKKMKGNIDLCISGT